MGCLYKRANSPYWWIKLPPIRGESGPLQISSKTSDKKKAQQFLSKLKAERWEQDKMGVKPRRLWEEAAGQWLRETQHKRTHREDVNKLRWLAPYLEGKALDEINRDLIEHIKQERLNVAGAGTANRYLALIRSILRKARDEWEWIERIPKVALLRENEGRLRYLTREECARLLQELPEHMRPIVLFSLATGLRQSNVKKLRWDHINMDQGYAWIDAKDHKNGSARSVSLNDTAMHVLRQQQGNHSEYVFTYKGKPIANVGTKAWYAALERAGIRDFRWHDLRHTFATWHRQAGTPAHELQRLGGWKTTIMMERYAHMGQDDLLHAAKRLDNLMRSFISVTRNEKGE